MSIITDNLLKEFDTEVFVFVIDDDQAKNLNYFVYLDLIVAIETLNNLFEVSLHV